jgi:hypothetical protein
MPEKVLAWIILIALMSTVICAYLLAWLGAKRSARRIGVWMVTLLSALAGRVVTIGYAVPSLDDFHNPAVSLKAAIFENLIVWSICIGTWIVVARFAHRALRGT